MNGFNAPRIAKVRPVIKAQAPSKVHPAAAALKDRVRFPDSGAVGAAPAIQTPVGRI